MSLRRTVVNKNIISEFSIPANPESNKVIILCGGMPGYPGRRDDVADFLSEKGYWTFIPRYRGTWESGGIFMKRSPHLDIVDVVDAIHNGFTDLWDGDSYKIDSPEIYVIGASFGGSAAIHLSLDERVKKVVGLSPVTDWLVEGVEGPMDSLYKYIKKAFGFGYRFSYLGWRKLRKGKIYNPSLIKDKLDPKKIMILHACDDVVVPIHATHRFVKDVNCKFKEYNGGEHYSLSKIIAPDYWNEIETFFSEN